MIKFIRPMISKSFISYIEYTDRKSTCGPDNYSNHDANEVKT